MSKNFSSEELCPPWLEKSLEEYTWEPTIILWSFVENRLKNTTVSRIKFIKFNFYAPYTVHTVFLKTPQLQHGSFFRILEVQVFRNERS